MRQTEPLQLLPVAVSRAYAACLYRMPMPHAFDCDGKARTHEAFVVSASRGNGGEAMGAESQGALGHVATSVRASVEASVKWFVRGVSRRYRSKLASLGGRRIGLANEAKGVVAGLYRQVKGAFKNNIGVLDESGEPIRFSIEGGIYQASWLDVAVEAFDGCTIAYTTDGREPTAADDTGLSRIAVRFDRNAGGWLLQHGHSMLFPECPYSRYYENRYLPNAGILRASAVRADGSVGPSVTKTYVMRASCAKRFPKSLVVSLVTDPYNLLDQQRGILVLGEAYDSWRSTDEAQDLVDAGMGWLAQGNVTQRGRAWERPCLVQVYGENGTLLAQGPAGMRVAGRVSRTLAQRSFSILFRREYGMKRLECELFGGEKSYRSFKLSSGGNNANRLKFKEAFLHEMVRDRKLLTTEYRPAVLFLNGEYWGPCLLTDRADAHAIHRRYGVRPGQVVIAKENAVSGRVPGDEQLYAQLISFADKDLAQSDIWEEFCRTMDVQSFADYGAVRVYIGDADWGFDSNTVFWRTRDASYNDGRWQCVLFDVEFSCGMYYDERTAPQTDHFSLALQRNPLFAAAMRNPEFQQMFLCALREVGSKNFDPKRVKRVLRRYDKEWWPLMQDCYLRYGNSSDEWARSMHAIVDFFEQRYGIIVPLVEKAIEAEDWNRPQALSYASSEPCEKRL